MKNQNLYNAALEALTARGCPTDLAQKAAKIVANDHPNQNDLGRSKKDQRVINSVSPYLQNKQAQETPKVKTKPVSLKSLPKSFWQHF
ncbi:hypothetical protein NIES4074_62710 (plasmid) [Cylindrospermum sp. NIES-4074]|nr:hypothetical protein NIES4074_62710 [Cylindrospermum sp. NIES-4074]